MATALMQSCGVEESKGSHFIREVYDLLEQLPIRFTGMMEARDALSGEYDVIVAEGFSGNVLLKTVEGTGLFTAARLRSSADPAVRAAGDVIAAELDFASNGASMLLGLPKPFLKAHGSANAATIPNAVRQLLQLSELDFPERLQALLARTAELQKT